MSRVKDQHLFGGGAAACALCCAAPVVGLLGVAGFAATAVTLAFAGVVFALVIGIATVGAVVGRRRRSSHSACGSGPPDAGPVPVELTRSRPLDARGRSVRSSATRAVLPMTGGFRQVSAPYAQ